ncbi:hypothetical protein [Pseudomonas phage vB_PaeM_RP7]|nr:MAG: hypothetical protein [Pseudomonas phage RP4]WAB56714.1 hypothetical protein [Pseudomonas phage vB_PaeM_RP15]WAB57001.1 hypothetical protein [Pseudomonas phage vB_PaeM_RP6]WAB57090.1 hypothetical protein [Pseudomonas phage vB_PaeM_RP7]WAB57227.1 hypothetical protein [Pseudomonas phage vB_PaeM_RP8]WAB57510.1 hypothetical protein [Pseudomonas phage vB_PaeM_RP9]WAB57628.1 hypothetical protein [Pseudomonas phage vB_PaeM_RP10]WAB58027.1 hypothetical protein [Pseudomonas phage vB_PaeM_RP12]
MVEPGYYWWLPEYLSTSPEKQENWQIICWHPLDTSRERVGVFVGPLTPPTETKL